jgi:hypothetical protein
MNSCRRLNFSGGTNAVKMQRCGRTASLAASFPGSGPYEQFVLSLYTVIGQEGIVSVPHAYLPETMKMMLLVGCNETPSRDNNKSVTRQNHGDKAL